MSYILDALKKAERDRPAATVPTVETVHQPPAAPARRPWPWIAAVVVLVNAGLLILLMRSGPMRSTEIPASLPVTPVASAPATVAEQGVPARPADPAPRVSPSETPATVIAAPQPPSRPEPERTPAVTTRAETARAPSVAVVPKPAGARAEPAARPAPEKPASPSSAPPVPRTASVPNRPAAAPVAPSPPASADISPGSPEFIQRMKLQVVVYSDVAKQRMVFIDNRKYIEGQSIDGRVVVESIVPDGAIVLYQGQRFKLRASAD
jgi:general secretion pathway protein B